MLNEYKESRRQSSIQVMNFVKNFIPFSRTFRKAFLQGYLHYRHSDKAIVIRTRLSSRIQDEPDLKIVCIGCCGLLWAVVGHDISIRMN